MKELNHAYSLVDAFLESNRQQSTSNSARASYGAYAANSTGDEDEEVTIVNCPHCGHERRLPFSAEWMAVPLTIQCRQCGKSFNPIPSSDIPRSENSRPTSSSRSRSKNVPPSKKASSTKGRTSKVSSTELRWYEDPILKYAWRIPVAILVPFFLYLCRNVILFVFAQIGLAFQYLAEHIRFIITWFILVPIGIITGLVVIFYAVKAEARKRALAAKCPLCGQLSALSYQGEDILAQDPRPKTVTRTTTGVAMFNGQIIPTVGSEQVQIIVYDVYFKRRYRCKFCDQDTLSQLFRREVVP